MTGAALMCAVSKTWAGRRRLQCAKSQGGGSRQPTPRSTRIQFGRARLSPSLRCSCLMKVRTRSGSPESDPFRSCQIKVS